jgi:hypothetical protein
MCRLNRVKGEEMFGEVDVGTAFEKLLGLPSKILQYHDIEALPQIVLHDMSHDDVFGLDKAVYLVDNPDFDCLKGVAGFSKDECKFHREDVWHSPQEFDKEMKNAVYNARMQQFLRNGIKRNDVDTHDPEDLAELGHFLGMQNPSFMSWRMRHGNHGILIFEVEGQRIARTKNLLTQAGPLLSLC